MHVKPNTKNYTLQIEMAEQVVDIRERIERMRTQITDKPEQVDLNKNSINSSEKKTNDKEIKDEKSYNSELKISNQKSASVIDANYENLKNSTEISEEKEFKTKIEKQPLLSPSSVEKATHDFSSKYDAKKNKEYQSKTYKNYHVNNLVDENKNNINLDNKNQPFPQFSLNVNNPISWKLMLLIMLMQLMTNIMLVVVLYLK